LKLLQKEKEKKKSNYKIHSYNNGQDIQYRVRIMKKQSQWKSLNSMHMYDMQWITYNYGILLFYYNTSFIYTCIKKTKLKENKKYIKTAEIWENVFKFNNKEKCNYCI
jgi:hypothetical protein